MMNVKGKMLRGTYNMVMWSGTYITDQRCTASAAREALLWRHLASAAGLLTPPPAFDNFSASRLKDRYGWALNTDPVTKKKLNSAEEDEKTRDRPCCTPGHKGYVRTERRA